MSIRDKLRAKGLIAAEEAGALPASSGAPDSTIAPSPGPSAQAGTPEAQTLLQGLNQPMSTKSPGQELQDLLAATGMVAGFYPGARGATVAGLAGAGEEAVKQARAGGITDPMAIMNQGLAMGGGTVAGGQAARLPRHVGGIITGRIRRNAVEMAIDEYAKATTQGKKHPLIALVEGVRRMKQRAGAAGLKEQEAVVDEARNFLANKADEVTPLELHEIRQVNDAIAKPFYTAMGKFRPGPNPAENAKAQVAKMVADNARNALRELVPEATKFEKRASRAIKQQKMIPVASEGNPTSMAALSTRMGLGGVPGFMAGGPPGAALSAGTMALLSNPQVAMVLGKLLESGALRGVFGQAGRLAGPPIAGSLTE